MPDTVLQETPHLITRWLGRIAYEPALARQEEIVARKAEDPDAADELLLLEHDSVFTIGRTLDQSSLGEHSRLPAPVIVISRGGQATWHGPGQLVGYPLLDLRKRGSDLHAYLRELEEILIRICARLGVAAVSREGLTGIWVGERKLASIGVGVRRWISMHGFALNVCGELDGFNHITPCGLHGVTMTSLEREGVGEITVERVASVAAEEFSRALTEGTVADATKQ
jgi:lipoyl(octanoyl) transferase